MNKLQSYILEIVKYFDTFCRENNIEYFAMGGSALGAVRHKGFIPWDDDFDIFLSLENYKKMCSLKDKFENERFCFQPLNSSDNPLFMAKIRMKNTLLVEGNGDRIIPNVCHGIYIDVMLLCDGSTTFFGRLKQFLFAKILSANRLSLDGYKTTSFKKRLFTIFSNFQVKIFGKSHFFKYIVKKRTKSNYYCHVFGRAPFKKSFYKKEWFSKATIVPFESTKICLMAQYDKYLTLRYGKEYMSPPSAKTINSYPNHAYYVNYNNSTDERSLKYDSGGKK